MRSSCLCTRKFTNTPPQRLPFLFMMLEVSDATEHADSQQIAPRISQDNRKYRGKSIRKPQGTAKDFVNLWRLNPAGPDGDLEILKVLPSFWNWRTRPGAVVQ